MGVRTLVKVSGSLLQHIRVFQQLKEMNQHHHLTICVGGGEQINDAFTARGNPITFGPFDRVCRCEGERELVEKVCKTMHGDSEVSSRRMGSRRMSLSQSSRKRSRAFCAT